MKLTDKGENKERRHQCRNDGRGKRANERDVTMTGDAGKGKRCNEG